MKIQFQRQWRTAIAIKDTERPKKMHTITQKALGFSVLLNRPPISAYATPFFICQKLKIPLNVPRNIPTQFLKLLWSIIFAFLYLFNVWCFRVAVAVIAFFVIRLSRGQMTKKVGLFGLLPRAAAAAQPCPGLSSVALSGLKNGG
ncbi:MAG TPA: hypothetical protein VHC44_16550 [Verrucomicrobiae bacterium]|nr:hypothetical protein [Verrucomicrobiae bacterium]